MFKFIVILVFVAVAVQGHVLGGTEEQVRLDAADSGGRLERIVNKAVADAKASLEKPTLLLDKLTEVVLDPAKKDLQKHVEFVEKIVADGKKKCNTKKLQVCVQGKDELLKQLVAKYIRKTEQCGDGKKALGQKYLAKANDGFDSKTKSVKLLKQRWSKCGDNACKQKIEQEMSKAEVSFPAAIKKSADLAKSQIIEIRDSFRFCALQVLTSFTDEGAKIKKDIDACIKKNK